MLQSRASTTTGRTAFFAITMMGKARHLDRRTRRARLREYRLRSAVRLRDNCSKMVWKRARQMVRKLATLLKLFGRVVSPYLLVLLSLGIRAASADECLISGPRYQLKSDTVDWNMRIRSSQSCIRGVRFANVTIANLKLISPPQSGQVTLLGPAFSYAAKSDFQGEDSFAVEVSGTINGVSGPINSVSGSSTIHIAVSIVGPPQAPVPGVPNSHTSPPAPGAILQTPPIPLVNRTVPLPANGSLPACPTWDWSRGAPPPMRPPFDRSKLYCPPPPFNPPNPTIGCVCPQ